MEEHFENKTKSCQPRRTNIDVERTFQESAGELFKVSDKPTPKNRKDMQLDQFTREELNVVLRRMKSRKAASLKEMAPELEKTRKFDDFFDFAITYINKIK